MAVKRDWLAARERYVQSSLTVPELAIETGIPQSTMETHCSRGGWVAMRQEYGERLAREIRELRAKEEAKKRLDILDSAYNVAETLKETIDKIAQRVSSEGFDGDVNSMQANSLLERLSSLSTSFEKLARAISMLEGGPDHRVAVTTLADILGAAASSG